MSNIHMDLKNIHERELHPFLVRYLDKKMNIYTKTIFHEVSTKLGKGKSEQEIKELNKGLSRYEELGLQKNAYI